MGKKADIAPHVIFPCLMRPCPGGLGKDLFVNSKKKKDRERKELFLQTPSQRLSGVYGQAPQFHVHLLSLL